MEWRIDKTLNYVYTIDKNSPYANSQGKVYQHHFVMCEHIGRKLLPDECVHHVDRNRQNNDLSNLRLMKIRDHALLHKIEDHNYEAETVKCINCKKSFTKSKTSEKLLCSRKCSSEKRRLFSPTKEELERLVWEMPIVDIAKKFRVSDVAIIKRCNILGVERPKRGYWLKVKKN